MYQQYLFVSSIESLEHSNINNLHEVIREGPQPKNIHLGRYSNFLILPEMAALLFGHKYALLLVPAQAFEYFHQLKNIGLPNMNRSF